MFIGHYGVSFAAKAVKPALPLWALFVAVQLVDVFWGSSGAHHARRNSVELDRAPIADHYCAAQIDKSPPRQTTGLKASPQWCRTTLFYWFSDETP